jgi:RNA polymerase sigma factor (sigma-70 family)
LDVFLALVERHRTYMYNLALRLTGREQDAKDVVQDSLLHAFVHLDRFEGRADLRTWLNRIVVNCALDHLRGLRRRPDAYAPTPLSDVVDTAASAVARPRAPGRERGLAPAGGGGDGGDEPAGARDVRAAAL